MEDCSKNLRAHVLRFVFENFAFSSFENNMTFVISILVTTEHLMDATGIIFCRHLIVSSCHPLLKAYHAQINFLHFRLVLSFFYHISSFNNASHDTPLDVGQTLHTQLATLMQPMKSDLYRFLISPGIKPLSIPRLTVLYLPARLCTKLRFVEL